MVIKWFINYLDLKFIEANCENLDVINTETFDLYTIAFGMRNVNNKEATLKEAYRVLRKGGRFMCLEFSEVKMPIFK